MNQLPKFVAFIKVILFLFKIVLGMTLPLIVWTIIDNHWWKEEGIIIPILLFEDALISFYLVYWVVKKLNFPYGVFSITPMIYGILVPLIAMLMHLTIGASSISAFTSSIFYRSGGFFSVNGVTVVLFTSSTIALLLTLSFTWLFLKLRNDDKGPGSN